MTSLDSRHYVATDADIAALAHTYAQALEAGASTRGTYLKALLGTTQAELGAKPRLRGAGDSKPTLPKETIKTHLKALESVHSRFYDIVLKNVSGTAIERNRRSGFARSAVSTIRGYIRAGYDITTLAAARVTKAQLAQVGKPGMRGRPTSPLILRKRTERAVEALSVLGDSLARVDKEAAVGLLEAAIERLGKKLAVLGGVKPVTNPKRAIRDRAPLRTRVGTFYPAVPNVQ